jgi:hypothetical protein
VRAPLLPARSVAVSEIADAIYQQTGKKLNEADFTVPEIKVRARALALALAGLAGRLLGVAAAAARVAGCCCFWLGLRPAAACTRRAGAVLAERSTVLRSGRRYARGVPQIPRLRAQWPLSDAALPSCAPAPRHR